MSVMSVRTDPATGLKIFNTRAAKAHDNITGKGYAVVNAAEQAKYREFKESRTGAADYIALEGTFSKYLEDVHSAAPVPREALTDECEILVVGAGFAGLMLWYKLS